LVSSFTIETITPFVELEAYLSGWRIKPAFVQYARWQNALFDPDGTFGEHRPSACVVLVHAEEIFPSARSTHEGEDQLLDALRAFRNKTPIPLFIGAIGDPPRPHAIALGEGVVSPRAQALTRCTEKLSALVTQLPDVFILDVNTWCSQCGCGWYDKASYLKNLSLISHRALPAVARGIARSVGCLFRPRRKVLAIDLDNTL